MFLISEMFTVILFGFDWRSLTPKTFQNIQLRNTFRDLNFLSSNLSHLLPIFVPFLNKNIIYLCKL